MFSRLPFRSNLGLFTDAAHVCLLAGGIVTADVGRASSPLRGRNLKVILVPDFCSSLFFYLNAGGTTLFFHVTFKALQWLKDQEGKKIK